MRLASSVFIVFAVSITLLSCTSLSSQAVGDPKRHGFVLIEGEAMIRTEVLRTGYLPTDVVTRISEIDAVVLENLASPNHALHGDYKSGQTWFSNLEPGTYRVREIHVKGDPNEFSYHLPQDADPSALTFQVGAGELVYLGYVEIFLRPNPNSEIPSTARIALIRNRHEFAAWEGVYDLYARTSWEPLILKRLEATK